MSSVSKTAIAGALVLALALSSLAVAADELDGRPEITPQPVQVNPGEEFDLEVSVRAWANSTYNVTFQERARFEFPGDRFEEHSMLEGDAILFRVRCQVESGTPDGDFPLAFKLVWSDNGTLQEVEGVVTVQVGEGAGTDDPCTSATMLGAVSVLAFSVLVVGRRTRGRAPR